MIVKISNTNSKWQEYFANRNLFCGKLPPMKWTQAHDQHLVREILAERPFDHQKGSHQIGTVWQTIVDNLNSKTEI
jgi:hypothetical protein